MGGEVRGTSLLVMMGAEERRRFVGGWVTWGMSLHVMMGVEDGSRWGARV